MELYYLWGNNHIEEINVILIYLIITIRATFMFTISTDIGKLVNHTTSTTNPTLHIHLPRYEYSI